MKAAASDVKPAGVEVVPAVAIRTGRPQCGPRRSQTRSGRQQTPTGPGPSEAGQFSVESGQTRCGSGHSASGLGQPGNLDSGRECGRFRDRSAPGCDMNRPNSVTSAVAPARLRLSAVSVSRWQTGRLSSISNSPCAGDTGHPDLVELPRPYIKERFHRSPFTLQRSRLHFHSLHGLACSMHKTVTSGAPGRSVWRPLVGQRLPAWLDSSSAESRGTATVHYELPFDRRWFLGCS